MTLKNYCAVPSSLLQDARLSFEARGLYVYIASARPDSIDPDALAARGHVSLKKVLGMLNELREYGWLTYNGQNVTIEEEAKK